MAPGLLVSPRRLPGLIAEAPDTPSPSPRSWIVRWGILVMRKLMGVFFAVLFIMYSISILIRSGFQLNVKIIWSKNAEGHRVDLEESLTIIEKLRSTTISEGTVLQSNFNINVSKPRDPHGTLAYRSVRVNDRMFICTLLCHGYVSDFVGKGLCLHAHSWLVSCVCTVSDAECVLLHFV